MLIHAKDGDAHLCYSCKHERPSCDVNENTMLVGSKIIDSRGRGNIFGCDAYEREKRVQSDAIYVQHAVTIQEENKIDGGKELKIIVGDATGKSNKEKYYDRITIKTKSKTIIFTWRHDRAEVFQLTEVV